MQIDDIVHPQIKSDFIFKSAPSTIAYISAALIILSSLNLNGLIGLFLLSACVFILILNLTRLLFFYLYRNESISLNTAVKYTQFLVILNSISWLTFGILVLYSQLFLLNYVVLILFMFLVGFSIGSISNLFWNWPILLFVNLSFSFPIILYTIQRTFEDHLFGRLSIFIIFIINLIFSYSNSKIMLKEGLEKIQVGEALKISLKELDLKNRELEIETFNKLQASKSASLVDFAGGIAHEINNPLTVIDINIRKLTEEEHNFPNETFDRLNKIRISSERIQKIINGLRNVTDTIPFESFAKHKLGFIIDSVLEIYLDKARLNNVKIIHDDYPKLDVLCVAPQISHILINILDNAIEAIVKNRKGNNIYIKFLEEENYIKMRIINDGPLIENELVNKIFQPFYTTKEVGKGPGLGLTLAKSLATGNGGNLIYEVFQDKPSFVVSIKKFKS